MEQRERISLPALAGITAGLFAVAIALIFFYAPNDPNQGLSQRIFYFHVPIALTAYAAFGWGAWKALLHLWKRREGADLESYVSVHLGVVFGTLTLLTGSIWARISWGVWWVWGDDELVLFLVLFLFYCAYFMLRFSVEPGPSRANMSAVYALFGVVLIPISFLSIRLSRSIIHPEIFTLHGPRMTSSDDITFFVPGSRCSSCSRRSTGSSSRASGSTCSCASSGSCSHDAVGEVHRCRLPCRLRRLSRLRSDHRVEARSAGVARRAQAGSATMLTSRPVRERGSASPRRPLTEQRHRRVRRGESTPRMA